MVRVYGSNFCRLIFIEETVVTVQTKGYIVMSFSQVLYLLTGICSREVVFCLISLIVYIM